MTFLKKIVTCAMLGTSIIKLYCADYRSSKNSQLDLNRQSDNNTSQSDNNTDNNTSQSDNNTDNNTNNTNSQSDNNTKITRYNNNDSLTLLHELNKQKMLSLSDLKLLRNMNINITCIIYNNNSSFTLLRELNNQNVLSLSDLEFLRYILKTVQLEINTTQTFYGEEAVIMLNQTKEGVTIYAIHEQPPTFTQEEIMCCTNLNVGNVENVEND